MFKKAMKLMIPLGIVVAAVILAMVMMGSRDALETSDAAQPLPRVQAIEVAFSEVPIAIVAHGNVTSRYELELATEVTGRVVWTAPEFETGEIVAEGTVLLRIDPVSYQLALAQAKAALATANMALADARALKRQAAIGEGELNIEAARQRIVKAEQDLANTEIKAPFNAVIDKKLVEFGQFISTGQPVTRLLSSDTARVTLPVTTVEAGFLESSTGTPVVLSAQIGEQQVQWQARLARIEARVDPLSRVIPVVVEVDSPYDTSVHSRSLPLGLFVTATLPGQPVNSAVRLPSSVLHADDSVFVVSANALRRKRVNIVHREGGSVVVNGGLEPGDKVVTTRLDLMFEGMKVEPGDE
ncbi:MAG: efflux RND transporter periplasmic adaptor subunit [Halioglobus sp.]|nr:efflux RND transporter periplasmic adaptor subunit [Halioglobus sp.]